MTPNLCWQNNMAKLSAMTESTSRPGEKVRTGGSIVAVLRNSGWLLGDKVLRVGIPFILNIWMARDLGPSDFGLLSYAQSLVSLLVAVANLGLYGVVVRELVARPGMSDQILGSSLLLRMVSGAFSVVVSVVIASCLRPGDGGFAILVAIIAGSLLFQATEVFDFYFLSRLESRLSFLATLPSLLIGSILRTVTLLYDGTIHHFAMIILLESILVACGYLVVYHRCTGRLFELRIRRDEMVSLLRDSLPLIGAGIMMMIYTRIDQVMMGYLTTTSQVGVYAAAVRLAEFWYVVPTVLLQSLYSTMIDSRRGGGEGYHRILQYAFDLMTVISLLFVLLLATTAGPLMSLVYGGRYEGGAPILALYVTAGIFVMIGHVREYWITMESRTMLSLVTMASGALINVLLNLMLIPLYGGMGAAVATVVSVAVSGYLVNLLISSTRHLFIMQSSSLLLLPAIARLWNHLIGKR